MKKWYLIFILFVSIASSTMSQSNSNGINYDLLHIDVDCILPCWNNIIPNVTTLSQIGNIINDLNYIPQSQIRINSYLSPRLDTITRVTLRWWEDDISRMNRIHIDDDTVYSLQIYSNLDFTLADVLEEFGEPNGVSIDYNYPSSVNIYQIFMKLYYPENGLIVTFLASETSAPPDEVEINENFQGQFYEIYEAHDDIQQFIAQSSIYPPESEEAMSLIQNIQTDWFGIGSIILSVDEMISRNVDTIIIPPSETREP